MGTIESEQVFLKWNNFENNLAKGFVDLLQEEAMVDVTLAVEGRLVQAHKIVLSICSSYFRNMFQVNPCQHPIVILKDVGYQELIDMLDFMYRGEANVKQQDLPSFLRLAETLKVKGLAGGCSEVPSEKNQTDHDSIKEWPIVNLKNFSTNENKEGIRDITTRKNYPIMRKKRKRSVSPMKALDFKINCRGDKYDSLDTSDSEKNKKFSYKNDHECLNIKEERLSDVSFDSYGEELCDNKLPENKLPGPSRTEDSNENVRKVRVKGEEMSENEVPENRLLPGPSRADELFEAVPQGGTPSSGFKFVETSAGGKFIVVDGYKFRQKSKRGSKCYWVCTASNCKGRGIFDEGQFRLTHSKHSHEPNNTSGINITILSKLRKLALKTNSSGKEILEELNMSEDNEKYLALIQKWRNKRKLKLKAQSVLISGGTFAQEGFEFIENNSGGFFIALAGYTYRRKSRRDSKSYWVCTAYNCPGRGVFSNGIFRVTYNQHNHESGQNNIQEIQTLSKLKKLALKRNCPGMELLKELNIVKDVEKHLAAIRSWRSRYRKRLCLQSPVIPVGSNYKILRSPKSSKSMICHSGFVYRLDLTTKPDAFGKSVKYWRCRKANCKARGKTDSQGNLYILKPGHNHPPDDLHQKKNVSSENMSTALDVKQTVRVREFVKLEPGENLNIGNLQTLHSPNPSTNFNYCDSAADAETYSIEKFMADNMEENYGVTAAGFHTIDLNLNRKNI